MSQSLASIYLHAVFSTRDRQQFLRDGRRLWAYIAGVSNERACPAIEVGGHVDHVHVLARFGKEITVADWIRDMKRASSSFMKESEPSFFWQAGYGVFSVEAANVDKVAAYIRNQEQHHSTVSSRTS